MLRLAPRVALRHRVETDDPRGRVEEPRRQALELSIRKPYDLVVRVGDNVHLVVRVLDVDSELRILARHRPVEDGQRTEVPLFTHARLRHEANAIDRILLVRGGVSHECQDARTVLDVGIGQRVDVAAHVRRGQQARVEAIRHEPRRNAVTHSRPGFEHELVNDRDVAARERQRQDVGLVAGQRNL